MHKTLFIVLADYSVICFQIFFHYSEVDSGEHTQLIIGASVEFLIQNRQGKKVATQVKVLSHGTVTFDTVSSEIHEGVIRVPVKRSFTHGRGKEVRSTCGRLCLCTTAHYTVEPLNADTPEIRRDSYLGRNGVRSKGVPLYNVYMYNICIVGT